MAFTLSIPYFCSFCQLLANVRSFRSCRLHVCRQEAEIQQKVPWKSPSTRPLYHFSIGLGQWYCIQGDEEWCMGYSCLVPRVKLFRVYRCSQCPKFVLSAWHQVVKDNSGYVPSMYITVTMYIHVSYITLLVRPISQVYRLGNQAA